MQKYVILLVVTYEHVVKPEAGPLCFTRKHVGHGATAQRVIYLQKEWKENFTRRCKQSLLAKANLLQEQSTWKTRCR